MWSRRFVKTLWPVESHENKKVIPMIILSFLICLNYALLHDVKDIFVLNSMPIAAIPWLKFGFVLPASILMMLIFTKMSLHMSKPAIFYTFMSCFIGFFAIYASVLLPFQSYIEPGSRWTNAYTPLTQTEIDDAIRDHRTVIGNVETQFPPFLVPLMSIGAHWSTAMLYVVSELWGSVALSFLYWGYANDICQTSEAQRFYALFNVGANLSLICCGGVFLVIGSLTDDLNLNVARNDNNGSYVLFAVIALVAIISMGIYWWMQSNVLTDRRLCPPRSPIKTAPDGIAMTFGESLSTVFFDLYVLLIGVMVIVYGLAISFIEIYYKDCWSRRFVRRSDLYMFHGKFAVANGILSLLMILVGGKFAGRLGWTRTALITPITVIVTGFPFMALYVVQKHAPAAFQVDVLVWFGFAAVVFSKSCKYTFFDPVKEMAFIPLGETRSRAKCAVELVGARLGKSAASLLQLGLQTAFWTFKVGDYAEVLVGVLFITVAAWAGGTVALGQRYDAKIAMATATDTDREMDQPITKLTCQ